ncbi:unnamed protein product [Anisakis simplex]|uniref:WD_REPEATS_REGION domain-containing protein n=1 Tax=Anisakis simplex TaxID=6269 RepID=A0A0M3JZP5_ANISI|nr:unnamed protein product [Anisakis simplex]
MEDGEAIDEDRGRLPFNAEDVIRVIPLDDVLEGRENLDDIIADANNLDGGLETDGADEGTSTAYDEDSVDEVNEDEAKITIQAHQKDVFCVDCFEDHWMASGGEDDCAVLFDLHKNFGESLRKRCEMDEPSELEWLEWHRSVDILFAGAHDGVIWMWLIGTDGVSQTKDCCYYSSVLQEGMPLAMLADH